jgi:hypothetical protein
MNRFLIAASALGALALTASPAAAQRYGRGHSHSSFSLTIGSPYYGSYYGPSYGYGYDPYAYGYEPYADFGYYTYPGRSYYDRSNYYDRRHYRRHHDRDDRWRGRDRWDRYGR